MKEHRPPNILFVFADQMRGMAMRCAGNPDLITPHLDRLAGEGVRCVHHFATTPVCGPNRATMLTGTYPTTHHVLGNDLPVRTGLPALGTWAKRHGYATGYIGKWHLDGVPRSKFTPPGERRLGFDEWAVYNCTHQYFQPRYYRDTDELIETEGYEPQVQTDLAIDYVRRHAQGDSPFCLMLSWGPPHDPYPQVPQRHRNMYDPAAITLRPNVQPEADNPLAAHLECRRTTADYYAAITALDEQLGRLLDELEEQGIAEDTLVVFTSDHGDMLWSHGWMQKQLPYEESIAVPLLVRWPGRLPAGRTCAELIGTVDLLPTLAGLAGWETSRRWEGEDCSAALREARDTPRRESLFIANYLTHDASARQGGSAWRGLRTPRYTYAETAPGEPWLLFDHTEDPAQFCNLAHAPQQAPLRHQLHDALVQWLELTRDPFPAEGAMIDRYGLANLWAERQGETPSRVHN